MTSLFVRAALAATLIAASSNTAALAQTAGPSAAEIRTRLAELRAQVHDRSSPEAALRSYFQHMNNRDEIGCLLTAVHAEISKGLWSEVSDASDAIRDSFFSEFPVKVLRRFDGGDYASCMAERQSYSYEIVGVEPVGSTRTNVLVIARNSTPLRAGMKPDAYDIEQRKTGTRWRFAFSKSGTAWKIDQIEEWQKYSETWDKTFKPEDLEPLVPSLVLSPQIL